MATRYCDPAAVGADNGTSWADAYQTLQKAADNAVAGDIVYCRGTETLAATVDFDINSGSTADYIKFIGCNAAGNVDGTRFVLDGNNAATFCILGYSNKDYLWFENFEFTNATSDGVEGGIQNGFVFINCISHTNAGWGFDLWTFHYCVMIRCKAYNNTSGGVGWLSKHSSMFFCSCYGNGDSGLKIGWSTFIGIRIIGCVFHDNGDNDMGIEAVYGDTFIFNCVFDGTNQAGETGLNFNAAGHRSLVLGCRFTNLATGLDANSALVLYGWNYFHNNTADTANVGNLHAIPHDDDSDTNEIDVDADDGFNDVANDDFNLKASRTLRRTTIDLNLGS